MSGLRKSNGTMQASVAAQRRVPGLATALIGRLVVAGALAVGGAPALANDSAARTDTATTARVITLAPHATELVYAAGGGSHLVGTVASSDFPPAAGALPRVGDGITLNQERILILHPTLLIGWYRSGAALQLEPMVETMGARVLYSRPLRLRDIPADVRRIGRLLDTEAAAEETAAGMDARIEFLEGRYSAREPVSVFVEVGSSPLYTIGADPLLNDALRACGAVNLYADTDIPAPRVSIESVLVKAPELIITTAALGPHADEVRERWAAYGLAAATQNHIHVADPDALFRPGPRFLEATEALCPAIDAARQARSATRGLLRSD